MESRPAQIADQVWRELSRNIGLGILGGALFLGTLVWIGFLTGVVGLAVVSAALLLTGQL